MAGFAAPRWRAGAALVSLLAASLAVGAPADPPPALEPGACAQDFTTLWSAIDAGYARREALGISWRIVRDRWSPAARKAATFADCTRVLSSLLEELRDDDAVLSGAGWSGPRRIPAETDVLARYRGNEAVVTAVRAGSVADAAGMQPGQVLRSVQGVAIDRVVRERLGAGAKGPEARDWALRQVLAGPRAGTFVVGVREKGKALLVEIARAGVESTESVPLIARKIGEKRDLGYLRPKNSLRDAGFVMHFDAALLHLKDTSALILDLRDTPSGGREDVVRAILGRFVAARATYQVREARGKARQADAVEPRGPFTYRAPVLVLVDAWTAAEGEALATGLAAIAGARLVGTAMDGQAGRAVEVRLARTGLSARYPGERALLPDGSPRARRLPDIPVDLAKPSGGPGDPILYQALKLLEAEHDRQPPGTSPAKPRPRYEPARPVPRLPGA